MVALGRFFRWLELNLSFYLSRSKSVCDRKKNAPAIIDSDLAFIICSSILFFLVIIVWCWTRVVFDSPKRIRRCWPGVFLLVKVDCWKGEVGCVRDEEVKDGAFF